jgi:hypothetical protein
VIWAAWADRVSFEDIEARSGLHRGGRDPADAAQPEAGQLSALARPGERTRHEASAPLREGARRRARLARVGTMTLSFRAGHFLHREQLQPVNDRIIAWLNAH